MTTGGVALGAAVMGLITPRAPSNDILNQLIKDKPEFYTFVDINLATARTNQVYDEAGTHIIVDNQFARGKATLSINEAKFPQFDLIRLKFIVGPFHRFFITNTVGQGTIRLWISRGYDFRMESVESINLAELAARLGSVVTYDRRGDVLWIEDFENGVARVESSVSGTGASVVWSSEHVIRGGFSCKLTAGSDASRYAQVKGYLPFPALSRLGYEAATSIDANMESTEAYINLYTGTYLMQWGFRFTTATTNVELISMGGVWATIYTGSLPYYSDYLFNLSKLVIDTNAATYERMVTGPITMPLTDIPCNVSLDATDMHLELIYKMIGTAATNSVCHIDSIIMTQNEP